VAAARLRQPDLRKFSNRRFDQHGELAEGPRRHTECA
jgi:hypothetical protein